MTGVRQLLIGSLSMHVFETRTATGSERFSLLTCLHTTAFALPSIFSPLEMLGIKIWKTPLSWHAKCPLPVVVRVSKTCMLKLPNNYTRSGCRGLKSRSGNLIFPAFVLFTYNVDRHIRVDLSDDEQFVRNMPCYKQGQFP